MSSYECKLLEENYAMLGDSSIMYTVHSISCTISGVFRLLDSRNFIINTAKKYNFVKTITICKIQSYFLLLLIRLSIKYR